MSLYNVVWKCKYNESDEKDIVQLRVRLGTAKTYVRDNTPTNTLTNGKYLIKRVV